MTCYRVFDALSGVATMVCTNEQEQVHQKERVGRHKAHWVLLQHQAYSHDGRQHLRSNEEHDDLPHDDGHASHVLKP